MMQDISGLAASASERIHCEPILLRDAIWNRCGCGFWNLGLSDVEKRH